MLHATRKFICQLHLYCLEHLHHSVIHLLFEFLIYLNHCYFHSFSFLCDVINPIHKWRCSSEEIILWLIAVICVRFYISRSMLGNDAYLSVLSTHHIFDLRQGDLQRDIEGFVCVFHRSQSVGVVLHQIIQKFASVMTLSTMGH